MLDRHDINAGDDTLHGTTACVLSHHDITTEHTAQHVHLGLVQLLLVEVAQAVHIHVQVDAAWGTGGVTDATTCHIGPGVLRLSCWEALKFTVKSLQCFLWCVFLCVVPYPSACYLWCVVLCSLVSLYTHPTLEGGGGGGGDVLCRGWQC